MIYETDNVIEINENWIYSMANRHKPETGLPVNIWIDEAKEYLDGGHAKRLKFQINHANVVQKHNLATMTFEGKVIMTHGMESNYELDDDDIKAVRNFMNNNLYALDKLADEIIYSSEFDKVMIRGGKRATEQQIEEQKKAVDNIISLRYPIKKH